MRLNIAEVPSAPSVRGNPPSRSRVPVGAVRRPQFQERPQPQSFDPIEQDDRDAFFNNLRTSIRNRDNIQATTTARPFTRPPPRR